VPDQFVNGYALFIAVDENSLAGWALPDVAKDVTALARVLTHPQRCAYPAARGKLVMGKQGHSPWHPGQPEMAQGVHRRQCHS
jgi:hypothetical protein